jgi:hypothetical protein
MSWLALPGETGVNWMISIVNICEPCCGWTNLMSDWCSQIIGQHHEDLKSAIHGATVLG